MNLRFPGDSWIFVRLVLLFMLRTSHQFEPPKPTISGTGRRRANLRARYLLEYILSQFPGDQTNGVGAGSSQWKKLRNYLYHSAERLSIAQVDSVCCYLGTVVDEETRRQVLQTNPRILRKTVGTNLEPTVSFLRELYGDQLMKHAIRRNPKLLLTQGAGYNVETLDLVPMYLKRYLNFTDGALDRLKRSAPFVFQLKLSKIMRNVVFLKQVILPSASESSTQPTLRKIISRHPTLLQLSPEKLYASVLFIRSSANMSVSDVSVLVAKNPTVLGHSTEHLKSTLDYLNNWLEPEDLRRCVLKHPSLLSLSLANLRSKATYWESLDSAGKSRYDSLAARVLHRAPAAYSLSLDSIRPKVDLLMNVWGVKSADSCSAFASLLAENPSILTLSLEGNLRPKIHFFNRTGYVELDCAWNLSAKRPRQILRPRYLASSLYHRLLPRWHFAFVRNMERLPLHVLAASTDFSFCAYCKCDLAEYREFLRQSIPRLKFSAQFDNWLRTGRPVDA
jgi:hypothetical protein